MDETIQKNDPRKTGISRVLQFVPLLALAVAITSILLTVAARKKELTCEFTGSTKLVAVNSSGLPSDVTMEFHGEPVRTLTKLTYIIKNTGAAAIKSEEVRDPVKLAFPASVHVLNVTTERTAPQTFTFISRVTQDRHGAEFEFPLLNSGDQATLSVYIINSEIAMPEFRGRIVDVPQFAFVNSDNGETVGTRSFVIGSHAVRSIAHWTLVLGDGALALLFGSIAVIALVSYLKFLPWRRKWGEKYSALVKSADEEYRKENPVEADRLDEIHEHRHFPDSPPWEFGPEMQIRAVPADVLNRKLEEARIPAHPGPLVETLGGALGFLIGFGGVSAFFAFSAFVAHVYLAS